MSEIDLSPDALQWRKKIAENATKGAWEEWGYSWFIFVQRKDDGMKICGDIMEPDAKFIASNDPDTVIAMIDEIERLRAEIEELKKPSLK